MDDRIKPMGCRYCHRKMGYQVGYYVTGEKCLISCNFCAPKLEDEINADQKATG